MFAEFCQRNRKRNGVRVTPTERRNDPKKRLPYHVHWCRAMIGSWPLHEALERKTKYFWFARNFCEKFVRRLNRHSMRQDQSFPAQLKSKKCDTFESLWGDFSENWSKIGPQTAGVRIVPENVLLGTVCKINRNASTRSQKVAGLCWKVARRVWVRMSFSKWLRVR